MIGINELFFVAMIALVLVFIIGIIFFVGKKYPKFMISFFFAGILFVLAILILLINLCGIADLAIG